MTMMANCPFFYSIMKMLTIWWGGGWRCLVRRLMAIIIACCAIKMQDFLDIDLIFPSQVGMCAGL